MERLTHGFVLWGLGGNIDWGCVHATFAPMCAAVRMGAISISICVYSSVYSLADHVHLSDPKTSATYNTQKYMEYLYSL